VGGRTLVERNLYRKTGCEKDIIVRKSRIE
jgi:hypothetical protein